MAYTALHENFIQSASADAFPLFGMIGISMKYPARPRPASADPFALWTGLALKTSEMMMASATVISHRTSRIAVAGVMPTLSDQREFTLMGQEKMDAATESAQAIATQIVNLNQEMGALAFNQMVQGATGMLSLAASRSIAQSNTLQAKLMHDAMSTSACAASQLADSVARVAQHGLVPIHSRATANAKRLAKLK